MEWSRNQNVPHEVSKVRPFLLGETGYENERGSRVRRIRRPMHCNFISGASGHDFGNGSIGGLKEDWKAQMDAAGSVALGRMLDIYSRRPWWRLVPEQPRDEHFIGEPLRIVGADTFILSRQEMYDNVRRLDEARGVKFVAAARTPDSTPMMAYGPHHYGKGGIEIEMTRLAGPTLGKWIDPRWLCCPTWRGSRTMSDPRPRVLTT